MTASKSSFIAAADDPNVTDEDAIVTSNLLIIDPKLLPMIQAS
eukprot:CAMPEP_0198132378 /NCGR_PEP_ID=MMETSP1442-20131203/58219_1 /TAXON_ID= /ORGANISM="Craspedostauros australis, Strain CCMP3328" /LENGTH=42 /DNA_ID= /DNA_START= /DNA_END= /DNA_ORIENTATION=